MFNYPRVILMKRGGKYRRCYMVQPYLISYNGKTIDRCQGVMRCAYMELV